MARKTKKGASGTSFHDTVLKCLFDEDLAKELIEEQYLE